MKHLLVFALLVVIDFAWSYYVASIKDGKALPAAMWSAFMMGLQGFASINYVNDPQLLGAAILGAGVGTFIGVWWQKVELITPIEEEKKDATQANKPTKRNTSFGPD